MKKKFLKHNPIDRNDQIRTDNNIELFYILDFDNIKENTYMISSYGRLFNLTTRKELMMTKRHTGYMVANVRDINNKVKNIYPHRIIAKLFIPKTKDDIEKDRNYILFIDGDKTNIRIDNMRWSSLKTIRHLVNYGKEGNKLCKITIEQVHIICGYLEQGMSISQIKDILPFNVSRSIISNIAYKSSWVNISSLYDINYSEKKKYKKAV